MEQNVAHQDTLISLLPIFIMSLGFGVVAHLLAKEKGRRVGLWTILGFIPLVNFWCLPFFIGAANLRLEAKIDAVLNASRSGSD